MEKEMKCCATKVNEKSEQEYWNEQWKNGELGWDVGHASPAIKEYLAQYQNKDAAVLIPGCGNAYEAEYLANQGFPNITLIDIAPRATERLKEKFAEKPQVKALCEDFFEHTGKYDLIIEQTFFCAIPPNRRKEYVAKAVSLLNENGRIAGLMFNKNFEKQGPPFGGSAVEYKEIFEPYFTIKTMNESYNSIGPRAGSELFINMIKNNDDQDFKRLEFYARFTARLRYFYNCTGSSNPTVAPRNVRRFILSDAFVQYRLLRDVFMQYSCFKKGRKRSEVGRDKVEIIYIFMLKT